MKILVLSDSHGNEGYVYDIMRVNAGVDAVIHLGDGEDDMMLSFRELPAFGNKPVYQVRGNCDPAGHSEGLIEDIGGFRFYITHGHLQQVKYSKMKLAIDAKKIGAQVALFGHTHQQFLENYLGVWLFNPGAVCSLHYGVITIDEAKHEIEFEHY
jgi:putative phosphoesterase